MKGAVAVLLLGLWALGAEARPFWVANLVWVRGGLDALSDAASRPEVERIASNPRVSARLPEAEAAGGAPLAVEWGVSRVNAPYAWGLGYTGQGVVVAGQDTGYQWDHSALRTHYRGWKGTMADHDYNWHDAIHSGGGHRGRRLGGQLGEFLRKRPRPPGDLRRRLLRGKHGYRRGHFRL